MFGSCCNIDNVARIFQKRKRAYFVDLFVRVSNQVSINMYKRLGYTVYGTVLEYYSGNPNEDVFDMRKALSSDVKKKSVIPLAHPVRPEVVKIQFLYTSIVLFDMLVKASFPLWFT